MPWKDHVGGDHVLWERVITECFLVSLIERVMAAAAAFGVHIVRKRAAHAGRS
jgi:hypothetical protein